MAITPLPTPPSRDDAANFSARADAFLGALPTFAVQANALADAAADDAQAASDSAAAAAASAEAAAGAEAMTGNPVLDSLRVTGTVLIGATTSGGAGANRLQVGSAAASAQILAASATAHMAMFASSGSDSYLSWKPGGVLHLGIGPADGSSFTDRVVLTGTDLYPGGDNTVSLGTSSRRWSTVYAGTGAINTSDEREKDWRGALSAAELRAAKRIGAELGVYRWLEAIADKGNRARLHVGVRAQRVGAIMTEEGLDPSTYGFFCYDSWDAIEATGPVFETDPETGGDVLVQPAMPGRPAGDRYGIRPDELLFFLVAAQEQRLAALEAAA